MRKIISNTTPILSLLKINQIEILKKIYGEIIIPYGVYTEIENGKSKKYYIDLKTIKWKKILKLKDRKPLKYLSELDKGEAEVIVLAKEIKSDLIIIDEKLGRYFAKKYNLKLTGTLGVLIKAKKLGFFKKIGFLIKRMQENGIWLNQKLINKILKMVDEI